MASSTKPDIVEQVARIFGEVLNGEIGVPVEDAAEAYKMEARAAVTATLTHAKSHVSKDMILAAKRVKHLRVPKRAAEEIMFGAMVDALLQEIGGGE